MKKTLCALLLLAAPAYSSPAQNPHDTVTRFLHALSSTNGLWIGTGISLNDGSRHLQFTIIPNAYTGSATLEILIETPDGHSPEPAAYKFDYDGIEYPIADYVYRSGNRYFVYLPDLQPHRLVGFSLGLHNTGFSRYHVTALLTVDNGQKSAEWFGRKLR